MPLAGTEKMIEELLRLVDDGTLTDDERSLVTQAVQSNSPIDEDGAELVDQLRSALVATRLPGENQATDKTLIQNIVDKLLTQRKLETFDEATNQTSDQAQTGGDLDIELTDLSGQSIGSYRILQLIGRGGMGAVYEATDQLLHRHVALKVMLPSVAARAQNRVRFLREAQAAARVEHDHICPIYQVGEDRGHAFIAMPLLVGETLEARMRKGRLDQMQIIDILEQVASGLDAAHQVGMIHRDIKPANVWIEKRKDGHERVRLLDFGLAQLETEEPGLTQPSLTQPGSIMGTPLYMAPEQARGETVDGRTDLFSVGAIMYELLTGKRAFSGKTPTSVLSSILTDTPASPTTIDSACNPCLSDLAMRLLEKTPEKRVASAAALEKALKECREACRKQLEQAGNSRTEPDDASAVTMAETLQFQNATHPSLPAVHQESSVETASRHASPLLAPAVLASPSRHRPVWLWPLVTGLAIVGITLAGVLLFQTPTGTLTVETSDDAKIQFEKGEVQLLNEAGAVAYRLTARAPAEKIKAGKYSVQVVGADGLKVNTEAFEIQRNGSVMIRVTASAGNSSTKSDRANEVAAAEYPSFQGKPIVVTDFEDPAQWPIPLVDTPRTISQIKNGVLSYRLLKHDPAYPFLSIPLVGRFNRGACVIRCKTDDGDVFFNFCSHNSGINSRNLSLSIKDGGWNLFVQRQDWEEGRWKISAPTGLTSSTAIRPGLAKDKWLDLAFHWSEKFYDLWLDDEHIAGGTLPTDELVNGRPQPVDIGIRSSPDLLPRIQIDYIGLWDQTDVSLEDARTYSRARTP